MTLTDDILMALRHNKNIQIGDVVYYVISKNDSYAIHKSRVVSRTHTKREELHSFFDSYLYHCEDGYTFDTLNLFIPVFETMSQAVEYVVDQLKRDISAAEVSLCNAQEHLNRLHRSLKVYNKYLK